MRDEINDALLDMEDEFSDIQDKIKKSFQRTQTQGFKNSKSQNRKDKVKIIESDKNKKESSLDKLEFMDE